MDLWIRRCPLSIVECECGLSFYMVPTGMTYHRVVLHNIHLALSHVVIKLC